MPQPYRVFISYSHSESKFLNAVRKHLEETIACNVRCSLTLRPGTGFSQQIKDEISRAHLFIPIVTPKANKRGWVHQEIGFAMAMNVPILPLAIGQLPQGMAQGLQAISLDEDLTGLAEKLTSSLIETHVTLITADDKAMYCRAEFQEDRTRLLIDAAYKVLREVPWEDTRLDGTLEPFRVRQAGALSSFSLPDKPYYDNVWRFVDGQGQRRSNALCRDLQIERLRLERLARIGVNNWAWLQPITATRVAC